MTTDTFKAGEDTISMTLAKLYTKCLSERRIPTAWKNAKMIIFKKGNKKDLKNCRPICLLSNIYKLRHNSDYPPGRKIIAGTEVVAKYITETAAETISEGRLHVLSNELNSQHLT